MSILKAFWQEFVAAFRAERQGGVAAEASRLREAELRQELREDRESRRVAKLMVKAKTPADKAIALEGFKKFVLDGPETPAGPQRPTKGSPGDEL